MAYQMVLDGPDYWKVSTLVTSIAYGVLPTKEDARTAADILNAAQIRSTVDWEDRREIEAMRVENGNLESRLRDAMRQGPGEEVAA